jgi:hypothetical protein
MHTNNGDLYALSYRLRSVRDKKRSQKEDFEKRLIQLDKQENRLRAEKHKLPWVPLSEPYQKGWKRFFILREDVRRSENAGFYQSLLDKINTIQYTRDKDFRVKKRQRRGKVYAIQPQSVRTFTEMEWHSPKLPLTEKEKLSFCLVKRWSNSSKCRIIEYEYMEPWRFVLQVRPHMITQVRMIDAELESKLQRLKNFIERNHLDHKIYKMTRGRRQNYRYNGILPKYEHLFRNKPLHAILEVCKEEAFNYYQS